MSQMYQQPYQPQQPQPGKGLGITALVLGIISVVFFWIYFVDILTLLMGITAIILAVMSGKKCKNGMATAGLILGIIGVVLSAIHLVACTMCYGCAACQAASALNSLSYFY